MLFVGLIKKSNRIKKASIDLKTLKNRTSKKGETAWQ
jgi:hypothetical protein